MGRSVLVTSCVLISPLFSHEGSRENLPEGLLSSLHDDSALIRDGRDESFGGVNDNDRRASIDGL